jgi:hypothetical protein
VQENINNIIVNEEIGKCPIEYSNQLSRAKIFEMKNLKCADNDKIRSFNGLY